MKLGGFGIGQLVGAGDSTAGGISWPEFPDLLCRYGMFHLFLFSIKKKEKKQFVNQMRTGKMLVQEAALENYR